MSKKQVWFRGNKAAQKWTEKQAEDILLDIYNYLKANEETLLLTELWVYAMETHAVSSDTIYNWRTKLYKDNISIQNTWKLIDNITESRVVKDKDLLKPNAQTMVLKNKHRYKDSSEVEVKDKASLIDKLSDLKNNELIEMVEKELGIK